MPTAAAVEAHTALANNAATRRHRGSKVFRNDPYSMAYCRVWLGGSDSDSSSSHAGVVVAAAAAATATATATISPSLAPALDAAQAEHLALDGSCKDDSTYPPHSDDDDKDTTASADMAEPVAAAVRDDDDDTAAAAAVSMPRAPVRTMQHLLQNVPYLFLDCVADSTAKCHAHQHRVGEGISAYSGRTLPHAGTAIRDVFVAQLPFDLPLSVLQDLADLLVEGPPVEIFHAAPHVRKGKTYDGCAFVKMSEADARRFIEAMHKRVLFDVDGVWVATTPAEIDELTEYCKWFQELRPEQRREIIKLPTPFSALTAEFALRGSTSHVPRAAPFPTHEHQHHFGFRAAPMVAPQAPYGYF